MNLSDKITVKEARRRALMAADWFVNTQLVHEEPALDANHGRVYYNYHLGKKWGPRGLSWSHGRAIMVLLGAWELSKGKQKYLDAAIRCGLYLRYSLQVMDARYPHFYGTFREEVPVSDFAYPRDAIEAALGLLLLYVATDDKDYLERSEIFADWYLKHAVDHEQKWTKGTVNFDPTKNDKYSLKFFQAGGAPFFWHLYQITGKKRYLTSGVKMLSDGLIKRFIDEETGAMLSPTADKHHNITSGGKNIAINDDGASIALTCAYAAFGSTRMNYLETAIKYADWLIDECPRPIALWAAPGMHAITLVEVAELTGKKRYRDAAAAIMAQHVKNQIEAPDKLDRHGAFRGEDEDVKWYVPGAKPRDFVTTRSTAYGALALLRLAGLPGPGYSAKGLERLQEFAAQKR